MSGTKQIYNIKDIETVTPPVTTPVTTPPPTKPVTPPPTKPVTTTPPFYGKLVEIKDVPLVKPAVQALQNVVNLLNTSIIPGVDSFVPTVNQTMGIYNVDNGNQSGKIMLPLNQALSGIKNINIDGNKLIGTEPQKGDVSDDEVVDDDDDEVIDDDDDEVVDDDDDEVVVVGGGGAKTAGKRIGEGTYGCVHQPSLMCSDNETPGVKTISKILKTTDAQTEIAQYEAINTIDPTNQFYLGVPTICDVADTEYNKREIEECNNKQNTTLLRMNYGGIDLFKYAKGGGVSGLFWCEFHRAIKGIQLFNKNGYIHYDIKPDNILYDEQNNRINFIDFGLMRKKRDIYDKGIADRHWVSYHPTYSLEHFFYNKTNYETILLGTIEDKRRFIENFRGLAHTSDEPDTDPFIKKVRQSLAVLFRWIGRKDFRERMLNDYETFIMLEREPKNGFLQFIATATNKFDIYGLGLTIIYILNKRGSGGGDALGESLYELAYNMINPNIYERFDIENIDAQYVSIMLKHFSLEVLNIKSILKSHEPPPFNDVTSGGKGQGKRSAKLLVVDEKPININNTAKKNPKKMTFLTRRRKFKIVNIDLHSQISKKRSEKYRFVKNEKRVRRPRNDKTATNLKHHPFTLFTGLVGRSVGRYMTVLMYHHILYTHVIYTNFQSK